MKLEQQDLLDLLSIVTKELKKNDDMQEVFRLTEIEKKLNSLIMEGLPL